MDLYTPLAQIVNEAEWTHRNAVVYPAKAAEAALLRERAVEVLLTATPGAPRTGLQRRLGDALVALGERLRGATADTQPQS